jgi:enoyl-CoA hydratase
LNYNNILLEITDNIGIISINRPEVRNALDLDTVNEIKQALVELGKITEVKVVIFTGSGEKSFAAGADIAALRDRDFLEILEPGMSGLYYQIENYEKPTIAAINGYALGGGCELAMACDIRIASENAKMGLPELNLAIIPGAGGTQRLSRLVGKGKAKELIFTGDILTAECAEKIGLVNKVVPPDQLLDTAIEMAMKITKKGPLSLRLAKVAINVGADTNMETALVLEKFAQSILYTTQDKYEGASAFLEKRKPDFKGR